VPRPRSPAALPEQVEAIVEKVPNATNAERACTARGEFNGERNSIKSAANRGDDRRIYIAQRFAKSACGRPLHEKLHSRIRERFLRCQAWVVGWTIECIKQMDMFSFNPESFATRCQDVCLRGLADDPLRKCGSRVDHMLAIVEDKKDFLVANKGR
jgi:hypothetical protein